ncbi:MAG TPA: hypothetical protein VK759_03165 [Rhizomicrobium sp.]|jgi:ElaB/YqjD/DUF883 family membrane-anchored ribosome-binding protein|nr:hypothetical protein [Rhizomicrobium sp.]
MSHTGRAAPGNGTARVADIAADIDDLESDIAAAGHDAAEEAEELAEDAEHSVLANLYRLEERIEDLYVSMTESSIDAIDDLERRIEENPWTSVCVALALGVVGGRFLFRRAR